MKLQNTLKLAGLLLVASLLYTYAAHKFAVACSLSPANGAEVLAFSLAIPGIVFTCVGAGCAVAVLGVIVAYISSEE